MMVTDSQWRIICDIIGHVNSEYFVIDAADCDQLILPFDSYHQNVRGLKYFPQLTSVF